MDFRGGTLLQHNTFVRYLFAIALVASTFALKLWLTPWTGTGAPFVLFFAAVLVTSMFAGIGPGICAVVLSVPLGAYTFVMGAGYSIAHASFQSLLFAVDGTVVVYLTFLMKKAAQSVQDANRQLRESEEKYRTLFESMDEGFCVIEVLFDAADHARDYRFLEVNPVFEKQTGIPNAVGRRMREIAPAHEEHWFQIYGQIALTGGSRRFENPALALGRFYDVYAFRLGKPEQRHVAIVFNDITQRKQAEEALRRTQALNQAVLGSLAANIAVLDREGDIIAVNDAWKRFAYENDGAAVADSVGVNYLQVCRGAPGSKNGGSAALNGIQAVLNGTRHNFELEYPCHSPSEKRWFLMSVTPLIGERGGAVVTHTDITKRKQIEEALQESEERLELAMEAGGIGTFEWDIRTNAVVWTEPSNAAFGRPSGPSRGVYDDWAKRVRPEDRLVCEASIQEVLRKKHDHWEAEYRMMSADAAEERWIYSESHIFYDAQGEPLRMIGVIIDITERKRIEKEQQLLTEAGAVLAASLDYEQTLANLARLVVQNFADWSAVDVMDEEGRLSRLRVASADPDQAARCAVLEQMPPDRDLPHLMRSVIESKRPIVVEQVTSEYIKSLVQGPEHLQALMVAGVRSFVAVPLLVRGQPLGALFLGSSTLSRVFGHGDLRLAEALADRAAMAIENARLYRASISATHLRDQVLGVVAHDLRNPLSTILTQLWALRRQGAEADRRSPKPAQVIERAAKRMDRLIQDLLDVAVLESGQLTLERARLSASGLIVEAVDTQRSLASSSSLELRIQVDSEVPEVWGDRDRLLQVFENLIGNAIKFTNAGGCITVGATSWDHEVIFHVADTGAGIAPENLSHVFDRFWQATRTNRQGAGLGLPITKGIVEAHGGRIWVESTPYRGTTFSFAIPEATPEQGRPSGPSGSFLDGYRAA